MRGEGLLMLGRLLDSVSEQNYDNIETIVSDHSVSNDLEHLCERYPKVIYVKNTINRGNSSANMNNAVEHAKGHYIKPMFQDEAFYNRNAISMLVNEINSSKASWAICGCVCYRNKVTELFNYHKPSWVSEKALLDGCNTIGPPSAIMYKKDCGVVFDENLIWLMDCDFYYELHRIVGQPICIEETCILVRMWDGSVSNSVVTEKIRLKENEYIMKKHKGAC